MQRKLIICANYHVSQMNCVESGGGGSDCPPPAFKSSWNYFCSRLLGLNSFVQSHLAHNTSTTNNDSEKERKLFVYMQNVADELADTLKAKRYMQILIFDRKCCRPFQIFLVICDFLTVVLT